MWKVGGARSVEGYERWVGCCMGGIVVFLRMLFRRCDWCVWWLFNGRGEGVGEEGCRWWSVIDR